MLRRPNLRSSPHVSARHAFGQLLCDQLNKRFNANHYPIAMKTLLPDDAASSEPGKPPRHAEAIQCVDLQRDLEVQQLKIELDRFRRLEEGWRRALDASNQGGWSLDVAEDEFFYSDTWRRMRGIPPDEPVNLGVDEWIQGVHSDDRAQVLEAINAQNSGLLAFSVFQYREKHRHGYWIWIESRSSILERDETGRASWVVGTDVDISQRKAEEQALEDLSRKLSLAIDVADVGIFEANLEFEEVRRDTRLLKMYGEEASGLLIDKSGSFQRERLHPSDRAAFVQRIEAGIASDRTFENEFRIITPAGDVRHLRSRSIPFTDNFGRRKLLGVNWEVTKDMEVQEKLKTSLEVAEARSLALEQARETIRNLAVLDELTGILNRRGLNEQLDLWRIDPMKFSAILHIDLDGFKAVNDTFGHYAGDIVLKTAARRISEQLDGRDVVARWGGDEFVVLLGNGEPIRPLKTFAQIIIAAVGEEISLEDTVARIGASIGIVKTAPGVSPDKLMIKADIALYSAKALGKGRAEYSEA